VVTNVQSRLVVRQRPVPQLRDQQLRDRVQVVRQVTLGRLGPVEQRLVKAGQRNPAPHLTAGHQATLPPIPPGREHPPGNGDGGTVNLPLRSNVSR